MNSESIFEGEENLDFLGMNSDKINSVFEVCPNDDAVG